MPTRIREFHQPRDAAEALRQMQQGALPLSLGPRVPMPDQRVAEAVLDLSRLNLSYVREQAGRVHIGSQTPLQDMVESPRLQSVASGILSQAASLAAGLGLRHIATLAGALLTSDGPPEIYLALLALDATAVLLGADRRDIPLTNVRLAGEGLLLEVHFAADAVGVGSLQRVARTPRDQAIISAVAVLRREGNRCAHVRLALAGASPAPIRLVEAERLLEGSDLSEERLQQAAEAARSAASPPADYRGSAGYRRAMAAHLSRRAIEAAWNASAGH
jgi:carbon-monoxide dehydrogenase medium subunit